jgi:putative oxidoreductase
MMTLPLTLPAPIAKPLARLTRLTDRLRWAGPLVLRLVIGIAFISTGWTKLHNLENITNFFKTLGIPAAHIQAPMVATIEFVGGLLLVLGLGTRLVAALLTGVMAVALLTAIIPQADGLTAILGSIEAMYLAVFVYLAANGGGSASLDHIMWRRADS